jgi:transcription initiation factor TFIIIB Brf1 subunit/transcription initiation factor TFIIB
MTEIVCPSCSRWCVWTDYGRGYCLACGWASHPAPVRGAPPPAAFGKPEILTDAERTAREEERDRRIRAEWLERGERRPIGIGRPAGWGRK